LLVKRDLQVLAIVAGPTAEVMGKERGNFSTLNLEADKVNDAPKRLKSE
jgi:hypothetical protein